MPKRIPNSPEGRRRLARKQANMRKLGKASVLALWVVVFALFGFAVAG